MKRFKFSKNYIKQSFHQFVLRQWWSDWLNRIPDNTITHTHFHGLSTFYPHQSLYNHSVLSHGIPGFQPLMHWPKIRHFKNSIFPLENPEPSSLLKLPQTSSQRGGGGDSRPRGLHTRRRTLAFRYQNFRSCLKTHLMYTKTNWGFWLTMLDPQKKIENIFSSLETSIHAPVFIRCQKKSTQKDPINPPGRPIIACIDRQFVQWSVRIRWLLPPTFSETRAILCQGLQSHRYP